ncbi:MAG TPA: hypothetical protein VFM75_02000 [Modicisalibacter sp.]|nr:hypothetical protein [Modicisalibacter sp.]
MSRIRKQIMSAFKKHKEDKLGHLYRDSPTWWFKFDCDYETGEIRQELRRMEAEGLVETTDSSRRGQTHWRLTEEGV